LVRQVRDDDELMQRSAGQHGARSSSAIR